MTKSSVNKFRWISVSFCILLVACFVLFQTYRQSERDIKRFIHELEELRNKEKQSQLIQRVSKQMEEIAYQQKEISEKRRQEAVIQTHKANRMQLQAETEREKALTAQIETEKAYRLADKQKKLAIEKQQQAEHSKKIADTLAFLALGRSLGSLSGTQYLSGNKELAALLAYAAWKFTRKYDGDIYQPAIFNALSRSCKQNLLWAEHKEAITEILPIGQPPRDAESGNDSLKGILTLSKYGEIAHWDYNSNRISSVKFLIADPNYDFRSAQIHSSLSVYALSFNGYIVSVTTPPKVYPLPVGQYKKLIYPDSGQFIIVAADKLYSFNCTTQNIQTCYTPDCSISYAGKSGNRLYVFLNDGKIAICSPDGNFIKYTSFRLEGYTVTAFCPLPGGAFVAGCRNGIILLCDKEGAIIRKLIGHQATVTAICRQEDKLFSGSYDNTLRLWNLQNEKIESAVIQTNPNWICSLYLCPDGKYIFMGDEKGILQKIPISPDHMAAAIRQELQRDFTREEWDYYIGNQIPFESYSLKTSFP